MSEYSQQYSKKEVILQRGTPHRPELLVGGDFNGVSESCREFKAHDIQRRQLPPKAEYVPSKFKFDGSTNQKTDFQQWPVQQRERREPGKYQPGPPLDTSGSLYSQDFQGRQTKLERGQPQRQELLVGGEFSGMSENATSYKVHQVTKRQLPPKAQYIPNPHKFDAVSTQHDQYQVWPVQKQFQREKEVYVPGPAFNGISTFQSSFNTKEIPAKFHRALPQREDFGQLLELDSVSHGDYRGFPVTSIPPRRHDNPFKIQAEPPFA